MLNNETNRMPYNSQGRTLTHTNNMIFLDVYEFVFFTSILHFNDFEILFDSFVCNWNITWAQLTKKPRFQPYFMLLLTKCYIFLFFSFSFTSSYSSYSSSPFLFWNTHELASFVVENASFIFQYVYFDLVRVCVISEYAENVIDSIIIMMLTMIDGFKVAAYDCFCLICF